MSETPLQRFRYWVAEIQAGNPPISASDQADFMATAVEVSSALSDLRNQIATAAPLVHSGLAEVGCWHGTEDWEAVTAAKAAMDRLTVLAEAQK
jgi:hypothetical protein